MKRLWICSLFLAALAVAEDAPAPLKPVPNHLIPVANDVTQFFEDGQTMMWPLVGIFVLGMGFVIERALALRRGRHLPEGFERDVVHVVDTRGVDAGLAVCLEKKCSLGKVLYAALLRHGSPRRELEAAVIDETRRVAFELKANTRMIGAMAALAPLLGLLFTIVGLIWVFSHTGEYVKMDRLYRNISEALLPMAAGLFVSAPLFFFYCILRGNADLIAHDVEARGIDAVVTLDRKARQSIRLIDDIEDQVETQEMPGVKTHVPDLEKEFEEHAKDGSKMKSGATTPAHGSAHASD